VRAVQDGLTIQQAAERSGVSAHTLRYYERAGLLDEVQRTGHGHRRFAEHDLERLVFLRRLRSTGMPIRLISRYVELLRAGDATIAARRELLLAHRAAVAGQIAELNEDLAALDRKIAIYSTRKAST
jgi:DNA-binding transcriptional MerR regulator